MDTVFYISGQKVFPGNLDCVQCSRDEIAEFGRHCAQLGVQYLGICCGNNAGYTRALAESIGRVPPASRFRPDMSKFVSDLHRRLLYLEKLKEMAGEHEKSAPNDAEEKEEDEEIVEPVSADAQETVPDTQQQQAVNSEETVSNVDSGNTEATTENEENDTVDENVDSISRRSDSPSSAFSIRLPPPPGIGLKRTDSKRSRGSVTSLNSNTSSNATNETGESFSIRLPPPPAPGDTLVSNIRKKRASSSSSSSDSEGENCPTPVSNGQQIEPEDRSHPSDAPLVSEQNGAATQENSVEASAIATAVVESSDEISRISLSVATSGTPEMLENTPLSIPSIPDTTQETDPKTENGITSIEENTTEPQTEQEEDTRVETTQHNDTEPDSLLVNAPSSSATQVVDQDLGWADFSQSASKERNDSSASSGGDGVQMGYTRFEKEEEEEEEEEDQKDSQDWASFHSVNPPIVESSLVDLTETKPIENKPSSTPGSTTDQWADFFAPPNVNGSVENAAKSANTTDNNLNLVSVESSSNEESQTKSEDGVRNIGFTIEYDDSEA